MTETMKGKNVEEVVDAIRDILVEKGELQKGDLFINTLSLPLQDNNRTNTVKLSKVE
jgi:pyruvate kinase